MREIWRYSRSTVRFRSCLVETLELLMTLFVVMKENVLLCLAEDKGCKHTEELGNTVEQLDTEEAAGLPQ